MAAAWLLTLLALCGVVLGAMLVKSRAPSALIGAAGAGLLFGFCIFWLLPEIAEGVGWPTALALATSISLALLALDRFLLHTGHSPRQGLIAPLLFATAIHSFLDGWSVRALSVQPFANVAVPLGLALHKLPEGLALGWIARKGTRSALQATVFGGAVEVFTIVGAWTEPQANHVGLQTFGGGWTNVVLAIVAGSFLFLGWHAVVPERKKSGVIPVFLASFAILGILARLG